MSYEPGDRVIAIESNDKEEVRSFGAGVYDGDLISPLGIPNPHITLDQGGYVWGYECWWGEEERMKKTFGDLKVTMVKPPVRGEEN